MSFFFFPEHFDAFWLQQKPDIHFAKQEVVDVSSQSVFQVIMPLDQESIL